MITTLLALIIIAAFFAGLIYLAGARRRIGEVGRAANIATGTHTELSRFSESALTLRNLLVKHGSADDKVDINGANDRPIGPVPDTVAAGDLTDSPVAVEPLGSSPRTLMLVAGAAIAIDKDVYTAAGGKVTELTATPGTYYRVGRSVSSADGDEDTVEVDPIAPEEVVVHDYTDELTREAEAELTAAHLLVKAGTAPATQVLVNGANDFPIGVAPQTADAEADTQVKLLGLVPRPVQMVAGGEITAKAEVFTAAGGKVTALSGVAGDYYNVGFAVTAAAADDDVIWVASRAPLKTTVAG